eukprot:1314803-Prorocentrum_lima.AAC.1
MPTLPIKHPTPNAPSNLGSTKDVRGTGVPGATNISGLPGGVNRAPRILAETLQHIQQLWE